jgi:putative transposase
MRFQKTVKPAARRQAVEHFIAVFGLSQRQACELVGLQRCIYRYQSRRTDDALLRERLKQLAREHPRWGYRFLWVLLRREGHKVNHKRVLREGACLRLYREEGLKLRPKKRRKVVSVQRVTPSATTDINQRWSMQRWSMDLILTP